MISPVLTIPQPNKFEFLSHWQRNDQDSLRILSLVLLLSLLPCLHHTATKQEITLGGTKEEEKKKNASCKRQDGEVVMLLVATHFLADNVSYLCYESRYHELVALQ